MTFTDADHDKAVELYERYKGAEWWPPRLRWNPAEMGGPAYWTRSGEYIERQTAIAVIAWAMVDRLGPIIISPGVSIYTGTGQFVSRVEWQVTVGTDTFGSDTRFLALAAAVEALDKGG